jgi:N-acetylmuramoyl-L-alanine amidase CwlA
MIYKKGSKGDDVVKIQEALKKLGYNIVADGDFGPKTDEAVRKLQKANNLVVDGIVGEKTWALLFKNEKPAKEDNTSIKITKGYINTHISHSPNRPVKYIAIHYTAGGSSKKGSAMAVRNVFLKRNASADFAVDDEQIVQINPDLKNYYTWSVGDKKNPYSNGGQLYGKATNKNTISIEICSNLKKGTSSSSANHEGWTFTEASLDNAVKLVKYLMKTFNVPKENVVRHYDISGKLCPGIKGWNNAKLYTTDGKSTNEQNNSKEWEKFKARI